jgi:hypothetical protein
MTKHVLPSAGYYRLSCLLCDRCVAPRAAFRGQISPPHDPLEQVGGNNLPLGAFAAEVTV